MKVLVLSLVALISSFVLVSTVRAENVSLMVGQRKTVDHGKLTVKFVSVVEDSRCPINAKCIWAGNAKIKISIKKGRHAARIFELNSTLNPKSVEIEGYKITYQDVKPWPGEKPSGHAVKRATISVTRIR